MIVVPPNLEKGTENVIRERTGSATGIVAEKRRGIETGIRIVKEVTETEIVIATTGIVASAAREGNTVIVLMTVTVTGAMILKEQISGHGTGKKLSMGLWILALLEELAAGRPRLFLPREHCSSRPATCRGTQ
jgi:hypothetical protein